MTDDQITDAIATEIVQRVQSSHSNLSRPFMRRVVKLHTLQALGLAPAPGRITHEELAQHLGIPPQRLSEDYARALTRAYHTYQTKFSVP